MGTLDEVVLTIEEALDVSILSYCHTYMLTNYLQCISNLGSLVNRAAVSSKISLTYATYDIFLSESHTYGA